MNDVVLNIGPAANGRWVECDLPLEPTFFLSAERAQQTARDLALKLTGVGCDVRLRVRDRLDQTVVTHRYLAL